MAALWCAPPALLSPKLRGKYFHWLDIFGKWSLIDLYVLVNAMVAFYITIDSPDLEILPPHFYHMQIISRPVYGLYSFCFAVILSLLLSHVQVIYHLNAVTKDEWETKNNGRLRTIEKSLQDINIDPISFEPTSSLNFVDDEDKPNIKTSNISVEKSWLHVGDNDTALRSVADISERSSSCNVGVVIVLSIILLLAGSIIPGWTFVTHGIAGLLGEFGAKGSTTRPFSLITAFLQLLSQSTNGSGFIGTTFIASIYIGFAFIIPLLQLISLFILWYKRMTLYTMKKVFLITQILGAFSALEVWLLGTIFTVYQIKFISYSVLDEQCTFLKPTFKTLVNFGFIRPDDGNCFQIDGIFHWFGFIFMFVVSFMMYFISNIIINEATIAIKRREEVASIGENGRS